MKYSEVYSLDRDNRVVKSKTYTQRRHDFQQNGERFRLAQVTNNNNIATAFQI